jgi:tetratricopeptide (TPR) repeat protein
LEITAGGEIPTGLARQEAVQHAQRLCQGILHGGAWESSSTDDDSKDVLYALVETIEQTAARDPTSVVRIADAAYRAIESTDWSADIFAEKAGLLSRCARAGWKARGHSLEDVAEFRKARNALSPFDARLSSEWTDSQSALDETGEELEELCRRWELDGGNRNLSAAVACLFSCTQSSAPRVLFWASRIHEHLLASGRRIGVFDEHDYLTGVVACAASDAARYLGEFEASLGWIAHATDAFSRTQTPGILLLKTACQRLVVELSEKRLHDVLAQAPEIIRRCDELALKRDALKARIAEAAALKDSGQYREAEPRLAEIVRQGEFTAQPALSLMAIATYGEVLSALCKYTEADALFTEASSRADAKRWPALCAHLQGLLGESHRDRGRMERAIGHYRAAAEIYERAGMHSFAAYTRILLAEALLLHSCPADAEREILSAMPVIEAKNLRQEGIAALALLRESRRRRQTVRDALKKLQEHLRRRI